MRFIGYDPLLPRPAIVATITDVVGSAPQQAGARIWVSKDGAIGTVGGGSLEYQVIARAREILTLRTMTAQSSTFTLASQNDQCCCGKVKVFFESVFPAKTVHIFGAGHIGAALSSVLSGSGVGVTLVDSRDLPMSDLSSDVRFIRCYPLEYAGSHRWSREDAVCIVTHSHALDLALSRRLLVEPLGYLGLIGSEHKARVFRARLDAQASGVSLAGLWDTRMHCPMGATLLAKNPKVIAIAIASELFKEWVMDEARQEVDMPIAL